MFVEGGTKIEISLQQWLDALRSGKYEQTRYYLKTPGGFCCLGVLADVAGMQITHGNSFGGNIITEDGVDRGYMPLQALLDKWSGSKLNTSMCYNWNDTHRMTFPQIADEIEKVCRGTG